MPILPNPRHERFAQELAKGKTADEAYILAGYKPNRGNAATLKANQSILDRIADLQAKVAKKAEVTIETLASELDEARNIARDEKQSSAMVQAIMGKAKLFGLIVDKHRHSGPTGGVIPVIDLTKVKDLGDEELDALERALVKIGAVEGDLAREAEQEERG